MARRYLFVVAMVVKDDDQTDPEDMQEILEDVLNCRQDAVARWQEAHNDTVPEAQPRFTVSWTENT
jgi:hypothetical protein